MTPPIFVYQKGELCRSRACCHMRGVWTQTGVQTDCAASNYGTSCPLLSQALRIRFTKRNGGFKRQRDRPLHGVLH